MQIDLPGLFVTDITTNSSSELFSTANNADAVYEVINELFELLDLKEELGDAREHFEVHTRLKISEIEYLDYFADELGELNTPYAVELDEFCAKHGYQEYWRHINKLYKERNQQFMDTLTEFINHVPQERFDETTPRVYHITLKDGSPTRLGELLSGLFSQEYFMC